MMHMKRFFILAGAALLFCGCGASKVTVSNTLDFAWPEAMVQVPAELGNIVFDEAREEIPSQITYDGFLIFQPHLNAGETKTFTIRHGNPAEYVRRTYGRLYPERYDDFAWENDRVAFRIYGAALKPIDGPSNGLDIWYKRTRALVQERWYADDIAGRKVYHHDHGEGLDDYKVGRTLGAGAMAPMAGDSLVLAENFERAELLENGPLRTTFKLWYANGETRTISLDAGSQLTMITQEYGSDNPPEIVAAGFPLRGNAPAKTIGGKGWLFVFEPPTLLAADIWLGLVMMDGEEMTMVDGHILVVSPYRGPVTYYAGYGWALAGMSKEEFAKYLDHFAQSLRTPLETTIKR